MQEITTTVQVKQRYRIYIPKELFQALKIKEGDLVEIVIRKKV